MNLQEQFALAMANAKAAYEAGNIEEGDGHKTEAEKLGKAIKSLSELSGIEDGAKAVMRPTLPGVGAGSDPKPEAKSAKAEDEPKVEDITMKAVYNMRFGDESTAKAAVMTGLIGTDYRQRVWDQTAAFAKYLRGGEMALEREDHKLLKSQIFAFEDIEAMVKAGYGVDEIKSTMVEAQGTLGGFAVPSTLQSSIISRLPGLTAVRGSGAMVVNLTTGNSTEFMEITGGNGQYTSGLRGAWGSETQAPTEKNFTLGMKQVNADIYTYKVPMSQSLVEDASNLVAILQNLATETMAMDEDEAFLLGDGAGKPMGILPGGANTLSLNEVVSGKAATLTADGIKDLKRGIAVQYRRNAVLIANSATMGVIEKLKDGQGQYLFPDLTDANQVSNRTFYENEFMANVAANALPAIFGNMGGYGIVERSGMTIARYQDSNTGINKVEFQFRRRVGGRVIEPWKFAIHKVAAS